MHKKEENMTWLVYFLLMQQNEIMQNPQKCLDTQNNINRFLPLFLEGVIVNCCGLKKSVFFIR